VGQYAKTCGADIRNFDFKIFGEFFKISTLDLVSGTASAELSRPTVV